MKDIVYVKYSDERSEKFKIKTCIIREKDGYVVEKSPLTNSAWEHIKSIYNIYKNLNENNLSDKVFLNKCVLRDKSAQFEYISAPSLEEKLDSLIDSKSYSELDAEIEAYFAAVFNVRNKTSFKICDDFKKVFGNVELNGDYECSTISNIDIIFGNIILKDGYNIIDYEWTFNFAVPFKYIKYRAVSSYIVGHSKRHILIDSGIYNRLGITDKEIAVFEQMEKSFQSYVVGNGFSTRAFYNELKPYNHFVLDEVYIKERDRGLNAVDIYFNRGDGISGESDIRLYNVNDSGSACFKVKIPEGVSEIRVDPVSESCIIHNLSLTDGNGRVVDYTCNGCILDDGCIIFAGNDPNLLIKDDRVESLNVSYDIKVITDAVANSLFNNIADEREKNSALAVQLNERQTVVEELNSTIRTYHSELESTRNSLKDNRAWTEAVIREKDSCIENITVELNNVNNRLSSANNQLIAKDNIIRERQQQLDEILNSACWRATAPYRRTMGVLKNALHNNGITGPAYEFLFYVKRDGFKGAFAQRRLKAKAKAVSKISASEHTSTAHRLYIEDIKPLESLNKKIAVHLHLYYVDLLDEFWQYFNNIPFTFDLYVSCKGGSDLAAITKKFKTLKHVNKVDVRETINRGRDIAPLYVQFGEEIAKCDYFMHVHSKKSLFTGKEQYGWRQFNLDCLTGSEETVRKIFALFESDENVGLFYPETFGEMHLIAQDWLANAYNGKKLLESFGIEFDDGLFNYPVGSFFWAKTDAVRPLFDRHFRYEDFPEEAGQTDGTIAHALERCISFVTRNRNYTEAIYDLTEGYISLGKSYKVYQDYFKLDYEAVQYHLSLYELVSFDIFDTLITRAVYSPDDLFKIMGARLKEDYNIEVDYLALRKRAEAIAFEKKHEFCSINDIYAEMPSVMGISEQMADELKKMEIELEIELCIPRYDMLRVFNHIKACGRKIVLVSDMYLTADIIEKMLEKCGFTGYDDIWISCEKGARKDNDTIWKPFFDKYGAYNTVHVGDNPRSDIQIVGDKQRMTFFVINPRTAFKMSKHYAKFKKYINGSIANSIMLGLAINAGLYNSPFAQNAEGEPVIDDERAFGFTCFGPLLTGFSHWVNRSAQHTSILMFLAREGYLFEKTYNALFECKETSKAEAVYFLTSRRAASVGAVKTLDDVREIISQYYRGSLSNMLRARLGIELYSDMTDMEIQMPEDIEKVMELLVPHTEDIMQRAQNERNEYLKYIDDVKLDNTSVLVDVGYSGTIQYYLSKMTGVKLRGAYLCTWVNKKPEKLGCECNAMYPVLRAEDEKTHKIFKNQLFLEAVLKAPFGQLICFEDGKPVYKSDNVINDGLAAIQEGIVSFARQYGVCMGTLLNGETADSELMADLFDTCLTGGLFGVNIAKIMNVQDDYCSNGNQQFDVVSKSWKVVQ